MNSLPKLLKQLTVQVRELRPVLMIQQTHNFPNKLGLCKYLLKYTHELTSVWPDLAKFCHFGTILKILGKILRVYFVFYKMFFFKKKWAIPGLFFFISSFQYTVDSKQMFNINKFLPMTGFEPRTSGIGSDCSTNWATTTSHFTKC